MPADILLSSLKRVRKTGHNSWMACCPAHDDHSPSLSLREFSDGSLSVKCFSGCTTLAIVTALGLRPSDLFPPNRQDDYQSKGPMRRNKFPVPVNDLLRYLREDMRCVMMTTAKIAAGDPLNSDDYYRLDAVAFRIYEVLEAVE